MSADDRPEVVHDSAIGVSPLNAALLVRPPDEDDPVELTVHRANAALRSGARRLLDTWLAGWGELEEEVVALPVHNDLGTQLSSLERSWWDHLLFGAPPPTSWTLRRGPERYDPRARLVFVDHGFDVVRPEARSIAEVVASGASAGLVGCDRRLPALAPLVAAVEAACGHPVHVEVVLVGHDGIEVVPGPARVVLTASGRIVVQAHGGEAVDIEADQAAIVPRGCAWRIRPEAVALVAVLDLAEWTNRDLVDRLVELAIERPVLRADVPYDPESVTLGEPQALRLGSDTFTDELLALAGSMSVRDELARRRAHLPCRSTGPAHDALAGTVRWTAPGGVMVVRASPPGMAPSLAVGGRRLDLDRRALEIVAQLASGDHAPATGSAVEHELWRCGLLELL